jgi:mycothiol synthase
MLPDGFSVRPPTMADLEAVVELMNASTLADIGLVNFSLESVGRYWQAGELNLETDARLIFAPNGQLAGFAQFMEETPPTPCDVDTWVQPGFVAQGVGEALLHWIDERA